MENIPADTAADQADTDYQHGPDDWMFVQTVLHRVEITLGADNKRALDRDPYTAVLGKASYDDSPTVTVGVRLRGKIGSFRDTSGKPKWNLDFNGFAPGQLFYGLKSLTLNNEVVDCSYLKEPLGYWVFEMAGVPTLRTAYAEVFVDGLDYGLYVVVETPDDRYLERTYADGTGNLYDGKYVYYDDGSYTLLDFSSSVDSLFQLEEGVDVANADIHALTTAVEATYGTDDFYEEVGKFLNWDEYLHQYAAEQLTGQLDGYAQNTNNYRVYFDPEDGKAQLLPWDLDYAFTPASYWGMDWHYPRGLLMAGCFAAPDCVAAAKSATSDLLDRFDEDAWQQRLNAYKLLTEDAAAADPRRECGLRDWNGSVSFMQDWGKSRPAEMRAFWGL